MDILEFISKSEWPILVGGALWYFRKPLRETLKGLRPTKATGAGFSVEFAQGIEKAEVLVARQDEFPTLPENRSMSPDISDPAIAVDEAMPQVEKRLERLGDTGGDEVYSKLGEGLTPVVSVMRAYSVVDIVLKQAYEIRTGRKYEAHRLPLKRVAQRVGLATDEVAAFCELRNLRNKAAHSSELPISWGQAEQFGAVADRLLSRLNYLSFPEPSHEKEGSHPAKGLGGSDG